ncbi:MAG: short-chain dehydrogenase [Gammaproteobacteria bacterium HGW-Gammaproteobacteria-3]|nr:MAG: short-chain dehydrogenase [Gammaproteobacteria bacterium HGW-Gammaproteobacteria-3]
MPALKRTVLVTGASSGIGRAVARLLLDQGHRVLGVARDADRFATPHPGFTAVALDLTELAELPAKIALIGKTYPDLDAAVFCAGAGRFGSLEEFSYQQIDALLRLNFTSAAFLARALLPDFKRKTTSDLIFIGSEAALKGSRKGALYCASKFAVRGFAQALREECAKSRVRVALINPGMVRTPFFDTLAFAPGEEPGQYLEPEDVAEAVSYVLNANANSVVDEINLSPLNKVVQFKKNDDSDKL